MVDELFEIDGDGRPVLRVSVQPGSGRSEVVGRHGDALKVRVASPPERGRANRACTRLLAETFGVKDAAVVLVGGEKSRMKRFMVTGATPGDVRHVLERVLRRGAGLLPTNSRPSRH